MTGWALGVDLGTSFAAGAVYVDGAVELLEVGGESRVPTTVLLTEDARLVAGSYAQRAVGRLPDRAERNPRRYVGRAPMLLGGRPVSAVDALAALLALFVQEGRRRHDDADPSRLVLTHPAGWSADRLAELREVAARVLPRVETELVAEPVAAAVQHGVSGSVAVYDLGGVTFDATVLAPDGAGFRVVGRPGGDPDLGGEVFDQLVFRHFGAQLAHAAPRWWQELTTDPARLAAESDLLTEARLAKEALSTFETASQYVAGADADVHITRAELDDLIGDDVRRSARVLAETTAGTDVDVVLLTGGAARTPLVERVLREQYGPRLRTSPDPKGAVALGAALLAGGRPTPAAVPVPVPAPPTVPPARTTSPGLPAPPTRLGPVPRAGEELVPLAEEVLDARVVGGRLYVWSAPDGTAGRHRISRIDPVTGTPDSKIRFGRLVAWAVAEGGIVVAERRDGALHCHTLGADLSVGTSTPIPTPYRPFLAASAGTAWAVLRSPDTRMTGPAQESGTLAVQMIPLRPGTPGPVVPLGPAVFGYVDGSRRLLDAVAGGVSAPPAPLGDGRSLAVVVGRGGRQTVFVAGPAGDVTTVAEETGLRQLLAAGGRWLAAGTAGLEHRADPRGADRRPVLPRPPGGDARWAVAGRQAYGVAVDRLSPGRGLVVHALHGGALRELGRLPALLGSPAGARPDEAPRVRADADALLVGASDGAGGSQLVAAGPAGLRPLAAGRGWLEPVGRAGGVLLARHVPAAAPGDSCSDPGRLVRVVG
ncbi:Hsp70 family protein [Pseudonocardia hydrocarbonoxydans]|uniref:Hsp70 family protein n=1 Tax=Pseudonocardia hydrocarbonoxydans TaxID=76726 RepID=UPI0031D1C4F7